MSTTFHSNGSILDDRQFGSAEVLNLDEGKKGLSDDELKFTTSNTSVAVALVSQHHGKTVVAGTDGIKFTLPTTVEKGWSVTVTNSNSSGNIGFVLECTAAIAGPVINSSGACVAFSATTATFAAAGAYCNSVKVVFNGTTYGILDCKATGGVS